jgi:hypothetical protein
MIVTSAMGDDLLEKRARQFVVKRDFSKDIVAEFHERAIKGDDPVSFVERAKMLSANDLALVYKAIKEDGFKKVGRDIHERSSRVFSAMKDQAAKIDKDGTIDGLDPKTKGDEGSEIVDGVSVKIIPDVFLHHGDQDVYGEIGIADGVVLSGDKGKVMDAIIEPGSFKDDDKPIKELKGKNACIVYKGRGMKCVPSLEGTGKKAPRYGWDFDFTKFDNYRAWRSFLDDNNFTSLGASERRAKEKYPNTEETREQMSVKYFGEKEGWMFSHPSGIRVMTEHPGRKNKLRPDFDGFVGWIYVGIPAGKLDTWRNIREDMLKRAEPQGEDAFSGIYDPWLEGGKR